MITLEQYLHELTRFFQVGGWVLYLLLLVSFALSLLLLERLQFRLFAYATVRQNVQKQLADECDWRCKQSALCDLDMSLSRAFPLIKILIAACPLIGLLGTVTGMIQVFDSLAIYGTGNPRIMASGVASATFPTMTGMAIAVFALLFYGRLHLWAEKERQELRKFKSRVLAASRR